MLIDTKSNESKGSPTGTEIQAWIVSYLAELLEIDSDEVNVTIPFDRYGLDSSVAVGLTGDLEDWLGTKLDPTLLYDYPTIEALSRHLASELKVQV
ncbi:MAG: acyl carrier protein [Scytonematopsis contorta HA4267-MV1]|jgi:acyl carrier protein|nr:acyl carrier protein [Scytonematopsis contorta HA4267-MV1]